ncbi:MAG: DUF4345 domain-containing protein [Ginsengibacter sp.]
MQEILKISSIKNLHLIISIICIVPVAAVYGINPQAVLLRLFDINVDNINLTSIFRAMMGLYLGISCTWIVGIVKSKFFAIATLTNVIFMGGLALGRLLSLLLDGFPSTYFVIGLLLELTLAFWGVRNLRKYSAITRRSLYMQERNNDVGLRQ